MGKNKVEKVEKNKVEERFQPEHLEIIKELWERKIDTEHNEDFHYEVARCCHEGIVSEKSLLEVQRIFNISTLLGVIKHYRVNEKTGMSDHEAIELSHKVEFIKLCKVEAEGGDVQTAFSETVTQSSEIADAIFNNTYGKEKIELLQSLPDIKNWKENDGVALSIKHYATFYE